MYSVRYCFCFAHTYSNRGIVLCKMKETYTNNKFLLMLLHINCYLFPQVSLAKVKSFNSTFCGFFIFFFFLQINYCFVLPFAYPFTLSSLSLIAKVGMIQWAYANMCECGFMLLCECVVYFRFLCVCVRVCLCFFIIIFCQKFQVQV